MRRFIVQLSHGRSFDQPMLAMVRSPVCNSPGGRIFTKKADPFGASLHYLFFFLFIVRFD